MKNDIAALRTELAAGADINLPGPEGSSLVDLVQWRCL